MFVTKNVCYLQTANGASGNRNPVRTGLAPKGNGDKGARSPNPLLAKQVLYQIELCPREAEDVGFEPTVPFTDTTP